MPRPCWMVRAMVLGGSLTGPAVVAAAPSQPVALVVPQPGLSPIAYRDLLTNLAARGIDSVLLEVPLTPEQMLSESLPEAMASHPDRPVALVGHGFGGRAVLEWPTVSDTCGIALLGTPLVARPSPWHTTVPAADEQLGGISLHDARTDGSHGLWPITRPESGYPASWLGRLSSDWLRYVAESLTIDARVPQSAAIWIGVAPLDELAPPETIGHTLPPNSTIERFGMLRGWRHDARASDLLTDPRIARSLARWLHQTCT